MLAVNGVGKPCAGEPHARIDGGELETEHTTMAMEKNYPTGNPRVTRLQRLQSAAATAPALDPPTW